jgi:Cu2+-containing amine oxidase
LKRVITFGCVCIGASLLAVSIAGAGATGDQDRGRSLAAKQCAAEKKADRAAFRALYGEHAMRKCIKGTTDEIQDELRNAAKECKAEREADPDAFRETYGANPNGRNALGKCVSSKVRAEMREDVAEFKNAAKECKAEREADPDAFRETYGANPNGRNALGKCVSTHVREDKEEPTP